MEILYYSVSRFGGSVVHRNVICARGIFAIEPTTIQSFSIFCFWISQIQLIWYWATQSKCSWSNRIAKKRHFFRFICFSFIVCRFLFLKRVDSIVVARSSGCKCLTVALKKGFITGFSWEQEVSRRMNCVCVVWSCNPFTNPVWILPKKNKINKKN